MRPLEPEIEDIVGASGTVAGVPSIAALAPPAPWELIARILTVYVVPLVRPLIVIGLDVVAGDTATHVSPSLIEYS
jgi:hypothetical protein